MQRPPRFTFSSITTDGFMPLTPQIRDRRRAHYSFHAAACIMLSPYAITILSWKAAFHGTEIGNSLLYSSRLTTFEFLSQEGLILSPCIKTINLITSLFICAEEKKKKKKHRWDFENIFTEAEAESVSANIGFCSEGSKCVRVMGDTGKTMTTQDQMKGKKQTNKKPDKSGINRDDEESTTLNGLE